MKLPVATLLVLLCLSRSVSAHPQVEHLKESYKAQGDALFIPLYWLPETHPTIVRHFPHLESSVDFEPGLWKQIAESDKLKLMEELGQQFDRLENSRLDATWARIRDWHSHRFFFSRHAAACSPVRFRFSLCGGREAGSWCAGHRGPQLDIAARQGPRSFLAV